MDVNSILAIFVGVLPAVTAVGSGIGVLLTVIRNFNQLKKEVREATELNDIREQFKIVLEQNIILKEQISELIEYSKAHPVIKTKTKED